ncbi:poly(A)-specific ribonuclease PARN-like isoform X2 [Triticum dicoccoides]|uniref:poly(A)-specific ribonuclease PARN-like isoform X2 n=1 Tax=Triticum dicoccoides TaxID=85692 RepID=UPI00188F9052|nr:poly(A)-specific ribonuclease PARN-like isoform X2 [Triticum dicoccoides]
MQCRRRLAPLLRAPPPKTLLPRLLSRLVSSSSPSSPPPSSGGGDEAGDGSVAGVAVKQVTRGNLAEALEELRARVRDAAFVGIDLEMSGVTSAPWRDTFELDRADVRYLKLRDSAKRFAVLQLGVCPFRWDPAKSAFVAHPAQEEEALQKLNVLHHDGLSAFPNTSKQEEDVQLKSTADLLFSERMKIRFNEWRDAISTNPRVDNHKLGSNKFTTNQFQTVFFKMRPAIMLDGFTSHQLKLIQQVLRKNFRDLMYVSTFGEDETSEKRVVYTDNNEDSILLMKDVQEDLLRSRKVKVESAIGIRHVIDLIASERKLIVGHSCFLDIAQVYSKFIGPLPSSIKDFALAINRIFPHVVDTRHLMSASDAVQHLMRQKSKALSSAFSLLCPAFHSTAGEASIPAPVRIEVEADETMLSCFASGAKHEAGYDAFMTGCVFAQLCAHIGVKFEDFTPKENLEMNKKLKKYINLLPPSFNSGTVLDLRTGMERPDACYKLRYPAAVHDNIVLIWGFQSGLSAKDIKGCICKVFGPASVATVFSIDSTAVLIQFSKQESVNDFLDLKATLEKQDSAISVLHPLSTILEGGQTRAANYDTYRDICSSSVTKYFFADQANAVCSASDTELRGENVDASDAPGTNSVLDETARTLVKQAEGTQHSSKKQDATDISCQDILDVLQDGKTLFGKQTRRT